MVETATIVKLDPKGNPVRGESVNVLFNPKELTFSKSNSWKQGITPAANVPSPEFTSGGAATLKITLFFDTYMGDRVDVREKYTNKIYNMMHLDPKWTDKKNKKGRPPNVRFQWGRQVGFDAVITSIQQRFTLFLPDGTPVRAVLDVTFSQVNDPLYKAAQNPTSGGIGGERVWTVKEGDTLSWIAFSEYNDPNEWRLIADANRLTAIRRLTPGMRLVIPNA